MASAGYSMSKETGRPRRSSRASRSASSISTSPKCGPNSVSYFFSSFPFGLRLQGICCVGARPLRGLYLRFVMTARPRSFADDASAETFSNHGKGHDHLPAEMSDSMKAGRIPSHERRYCHFAFGCGSQAIARRPEHFVEAEFILEDDASDGRSKDSRIASGCELDL